jgi:hypothetical protein
VSGGQRSAQSRRRENARRSLTAEEACRIVEQTGIDCGAAPFDVEPSSRGLEMKLEHGLREPSTNATDDDPVVTAKIALAHRNQSADHYTGSSGWRTRPRRELG